jgi:hypothetical protein
MRPVIEIIEPSCALISLIIFFGPFMRMCIPSGIPPLLPGSSTVRRPAVKTYPLLHPGIDTRMESLGTGLVSCAKGTALNRATVTNVTAADAVVLIGAKCNGIPYCSHKTRRRSL